MNRTQKIYLVNSKPKWKWFCMVKVFQRKIFPRLFDQMLSIWFTFTFKGSELILQKMDGVELRSFCHLPKVCIVSSTSESAVTMIVSWLLGSLNMDRVSTKMTMRLRSSPNIWKAQNLLAREPVGEFVMRIGFNSLPRFEELTKFKRLFLFQDNCLIPPILSKI